MIGQVDHEPMQPRHSLKMAKVAESMVSKNDDEIKTNAKFFFLLFNPNVITNRLYLKYK